jgi:hypothetical protein
VGRTPALKGRGSGGRSERRTKAAPKERPRMSGNRRRPRVGKRRPPPGEAAPCGRPVALDSHPPPEPRRLRRGGREITGSRITAVAVHRPRSSPSTAYRESSATALGHRRPPRIGNRRPPPSVIAGHRVSGIAGHPRVACMLLQATREPLAWSCKPPGSCLRALTRSGAPCRRSHGGSPRSPG